MLWLTTVNPTFNKKVEIWGGGRGMGGEDDAEKVGRTSGKILATPLNHLNQLIRKSCVS